MTEQQTPVEPDEEHGEVSLTNWEFIGTVPTVEQVRDLLASLPDVWGVPYVDFIEYVQALPQRKKVKRPHPTNPSVMVDDYVDCYTLYMSVAGRIKMLERAAHEHSWRVDFVPEPVTPSGIPGYLSIETRLVFRTYVVIMEPIRTGADEKPLYRRLGRKYGTAWVPASGGSNAAGTNPYEKVETSALGRALAAWGFGVMPGSGIASVEEMDAIKGNRAFVEAEAAASQGGRGRRTPGGTRQSRQEMLQEALALAEEVRQYRGIEPEEMQRRIGQYLEQTLGIADSVNPDGSINWMKVKDGQILLLANSFRDTLRNLRDQQSPV